MFIFIGVMSIAGWWWLIHARRSPADLDSDSDSMPSLISDSDSDSDSDSYQVDSDSYNDEDNVRTDLYTDTLMSPRWTTPTDIEKLKKLDDELDKYMGRDVTE